jgi:predicted DNA-binding transcriptional regulator AlpA
MARRRIRLDELPEVTGEQLRRETGLSRARLYRWIGWGLLPQSETRVRIGAREHAVWPAAVVPRIRSLLQLLAAGRRCADLPRWGQAIDT